MTRLTNSTREAIATKAVNHAFNPKLEALTAEADALGREAYAFVIPADEAEAAMKMPSHWFRMDSCLHFNAGGYNVRLQLIGNGVPVPYAPKGSGKSGWYCNMLGSIPAGDLCDRIQAHATAAKAYSDKRAKAYRAVLNVVASVTTIKRLREVWPEGEQFFKAYEDSPAVSLPAVRVDEVNAMLEIGK